MARVFAGTDPGGRPVAIKVLKEGHSPEYRTAERFTAEVEAVRQLHHRNIVEIYDFGTLPDGRPYFVMELLPGQTLQQRIEQEGPLTLLQAAPIFIQACDALEVAHAQGIIHRDLKPDNIYLVGAPGDAQPQVKLLDFGIAKVSHQRSSGAVLTSHGLTVGTPLYMSPEQIRAQDLDARSDVYTLGVSLFQSLTGEVPFYAESHAQTAIMHLSKAPPRPSEVSDLPLPEQADEIVLRCLEKSPEQRYASVGALRDALQGAVTELMASRKLLGSQPLRPQRPQRAGLPSVPPMPQAAPAPAAAPASDAGALARTEPAGEAADGEPGRAMLPSIPPLPKGAPVKLTPGEGVPRVSLPSIPPLPPGVRAAALREEGLIGASLAEDESQERTTSRVRAIPGEPEPERGFGLRQFLFLVVLLVVAALLGWLGWQLAATSP